MFLGAIDMGWFGGKSETPDPTSRADRQKCWESRDGYFACLDRANVVKPGDEGTACADVKKIYEKNCAKSWVCVRVRFNFHPSSVNVRSDRLLQQAESPGGTTARRSRASEDTGRLREEVVST